MQLARLLTAARTRLKWYARTNTASEGATITGVAEGDGWRITIPAATTANFDAGLWTWQAVATEDTNNTQYTAGRGQFTVKATASYTGTPGAFDDRSRAEIDLENVDAAIRTLSSGGMVQEYSIGGSQPASLQDDGAARIAQHPAK
jgi:hypothetical protein